MSVDRRIWPVLNGVSIIVRALDDDEAGVWVAASQDIDGLTVEAESLEALERKVVAAISGFAGAEWHIDRLSARLHPPLPCRASPPQGERSTRGLSTASICRSADERFERER
jgi:hypothetical protein